MKWLVSFSLMLGMAQAYSQSVELMPGSEYTFVDVQWLSRFDQSEKWSFFSRTRATTVGDQETNLFTGGYLNYTTAKGLGASLVGRIATGGSGSDAGIHYFQAHESWMLFALASIELSDELSYGWFSIFRFTPVLSEKWRLYNSLELFSNFNDAGHYYSVQRLRVGVDYKRYQFGPGIDLSAFGEGYESNPTNFGFFIRKQFR
jgi:hypothetical protein